eukprot:4162561-Pyramimonas_sp.AAC.1
MSVGVVLFSMSNWEDRVSMPFGRLLSRSAPPTLRPRFPATGLDGAGNPRRTSQRPRRPSSRISSGG